MSASQNQYGIGLDKDLRQLCGADAAQFSGAYRGCLSGSVSTVYEGRSFTWSQTFVRCRRFASFLAGRGIGHGDTVAAMLPNIPAMNELHFAVPMAGAVLNALTSGSMRLRSRSSSTTAAPKSSWSIRNFPA